jgi:small subunit ribosomal protein S1
MSELDSFTDKIFKEDFSKELEEKLKKQPKEGTIAIGTILDISTTKVFVDVGLKTEGVILLSEFGTMKLNVGDKIEVFVTRLEDKSGSTQLSFDRVGKEKSWSKFEKACETTESVNGKIIGKLMKGGYAVEIEGILAFLPGSQLDIKPVKDPTTLYNVEQKFRVLKIDRNQGNIVVSRRSILEDSRKEARAIMLSSINEGMQLKGTVKNITNYGAFIDLGEIDGLLHMSDISWNKISHPTELLTIGQKVNVTVIKYNKELQRVSLGMKQLSDNPWDGLDNKFKIDHQYQGIVSEINDYGIFVEMCEDKNITGFVYPNEVLWNNKKTVPKDFLKCGQKIDVKVLEIDILKHRMNLSIKKCTKNPWKELLQKYPEGSIVKTQVVKILEFGLLVELLDKNETINKISLLIPAIELDWNYKPKESLSKFKINDKINCMVFDSDIEKERITLSIKRLEQNDPKKIANKIIQKGIVTCKIIKVTDNGLDVEMDNNIKGFIKRIDLSKDRTQQHPERFTIGDRIDAKAINFDKINKLLKLSVKQLEIDEEKKAIHDYGSLNSGASLADILGSATEDQN